MVMCPNEQHSACWVKTKVTPVVQEWMDRSKQVELKTPGGVHINGGGREDRIKAHAIRDFEQKVNVVAFHMVGEE